MSRVLRRSEIRPQFNNMMTIRDFSQKRGRILIVRNVGGLGDILMHRMMFEDFKKKSPGCEIHFACPKMYHEAVVDHPFLARVLDSATVDKNDYIASYNTSSACGRYEMSKGIDSDKNRSDIWNLHCSNLELENHNMHIRLKPQEKIWGNARVDTYRNGRPVVVVAPVSNMGNKNLSDQQIDWLLSGLEERGLSPVGLHTDPILGFSKRGTPVISRVSIREWMAVLAAADYVVSVDTAAFHCAGGLGCPLTGIFTFANGEIYGKYYNFELVQKHRSRDPLWTCGPCYNWCNCPKVKNGPRPCLTELTKDMLLDGVDRMLNRWPKGEECRSE